MRRSVAALLLLAFAASAQDIRPGPAPVFHPGYVVNNWYTPVFYGLLSGTPVANGANVANCSFGAVMYPISISLLGSRIATASAGGNVQWAVYNNGVWGRPASLVVATPSVSTTSTGTTSGVAVASLPAGDYWFCQNTDNGTAIFSSQGAAQTFIGALAQGNAGAGALTTVTGVTIAQTFGTWPSWTSATAWTDSITALAPFLTFKVASVP